MVNFVTKASDLHWSDCGPKLVGKHDFILNYLIYPYIIALPNETDLAKVQSDSTNQTRLITRIIDIGLKYFFSSSHTLQKQRCQIIFFCAKMSNTKTQSNHMNSTKLSQKHLMQRHKLKSLLPTCGQSEWWSY